MLVDHRQREWLAAEGVTLPDPGEEPRVSLEAAERDVLAVVRRRGRVLPSFGQRLHRAAERRPRLVQDDLVARVDELERGRQPGEPPADDRDLLHTMWTHRHALVTPLVSETGAQRLKESQRRVVQWTNRPENVSPPVSETGGETRRITTEPERSQEVGGDDPELRQRGQLRRAFEDVEAARLDALQRRAVQAGERSDAGRAAAVEVTQQRQPLLQIASRPRRLERHQRLPRRGQPALGDVLLGDTERGEFVLRQVDTSE